MEQNELIRALAQQFGMEVEAFKAAVKAQCFEKGVASDYQLTQFLMVAADRQLNPFAPGEMYCFVNKAGKLVIGTGIDGWIKIVHRHKDFAGFEAVEVWHGDAFEGVEMTMYHKRWERPGKYTAYLNEWNVRVLNVEGWKNQPRHLTFNKAFQECARFTFSITDVVGADDIEAMRQAENEKAEAAAAVFQRAIEHQPTESANFVHIGAPVPVGVHSDPARPDGHLRAHVEQPLAAAGTGSEDSPKSAAPEPAAATPSRKGRPPGAKNKPKPDPVCWKCGKPSTRVISFFNGPSFDCCEEHDDPKPTDAVKGTENEPANGQGTPETPAAPVQPETSAAPSAAETQRAATGLGLPGHENCDPASHEREHPLETFIRAHDVPQRRVDMALSKYGAEKLADLTADQEAAILGVFEKSYRVEGMGA